MCYLREIKEIVILWNLEFQATEDFNDFSPCDMCSLCDNYKDYLMKNNEMGKKLKWVCTSDVIINIWHVSSSYSQFLNRKKSSRNKVKCVICNDGYNELGDQFLG